MKKVFHIYGGAICTYCYRHNSIDEINSPPTTTNDIRQDAGKQSRSIDEQKVSQESMERVSAL
jgi:hypothetical protein